MKVTAPQRRALTVLAQNPDGVTAANLGQALSVKARKVQGFALIGGTMANRLVGMALARRIDHYPMGSRRSATLFTITTSGRMALGSAAPAPEQSADLLETP